MNRPSDLQACYAGYSALRAELSAWLTQSVRSDGPGPNGGGEDEANYALAWFGHYLVTREPAIADRFRELLAALAAWVETSCFHGYEPEAAAANVDPTSDLHASADYRRDLARAMTRRALERAIAA